MLNNTPDAMSLQQSYNWSGSVIGSYPDKIDLNREASFTHSAIPPSDRMLSSCGAVIYTGTNQAGVADNCAWHVPGEGNNYKVYVQAGPISNYRVGFVDWDTIRNSLQNSSHTSDSNDQNNHVGASANITPSGNTATISATFIINYFAFTNSVTTYHMEYYCVTSQK